MGASEFLKINEWWKAVLICGVASIAISLLFEIDIVNRKHLMGTGIGMFIIGIANWIALKTIVQQQGLQGFFYGEIPVHNTFTKIMQAIGFVIAIGFGILIIWELI